MHKKSLARNHLSFCQFQESLKGNVISGESYGRGPEGFLKTMEGTINQPERSHFSIDRGFLRNLRNIVKESALHMQNSKISTPAHNNVSQTRIFLFSSHPFTPDHPQPRVGITFFTRNSFCPVSPLISHNRPYLVDSFDR